MKQIVYSCLYFLLLYSHTAIGQDSRSKNKTSVAYRNSYQRMAAGTFHTLEIRNGTLWAYGLNSDGELGIGNTTDYYTPQQVGVDNKWVSVAAGRYNSLALKSDGTLWAWGYNLYGQLGIGNTTNSTTPQQVGGDNKWVSVTAGSFHTLALKSDGTLWAWGRNSDGQLGTGNTTNYSTPQQVGGDNKWVSIEAGFGHSLALKSDGTLWAWGRNSDGQLGTGNTTNASAPSQVGTDTKWVSIEAGETYTLALKSDGTLWAWGDNSFNQLGTGNTTDYSTPQQVGGDNKWVSITAGQRHSLALKSDGTLWAWGYNEQGQLGTGNTTDASIPQQVATDNKWVSIEAGGLHTLAIKSDGTLWAWGYNSNGQLGTGNTTDYYNPQQVGTDTKWVSVSAGQYHSLALKSDGTLWTWGYNEQGQLGNGNTTSVATPQQIGGGNRWVSVEAGLHHTLAIKSDGTLWAWGYNSNGQLGNGNTTNSNVPVQVGGDNKWVSVTAGQYHSLALKSDGTLWTWGYNIYGQLGNGNTTSATTPQQAGGDNRWVSVGAGQYHSLALKSDGTLWAWGFNSAGQLGTGNTTNSNVPVQVGGDNKWVSITVGDNHTLAVKSDGTLWVWGANNFGQVGNGNTTDVATPQQVGTDNQWLSVAAGDSYSLALKSDGSLWAWGSNSNGSLGTGNTNHLSTPQQVATDVVTMAGGGSHSALIRSNRNTICLTGLNNYGQVGDGTTTSKSTFNCLFTNNTPGIATTFSATSICTGATITVPYTAFGTYNPGNIFTAQLSNATGNFASPVVIGSVSSVSSGTITAIVPAGTPAGTGYRIRVVSSLPAVVGNDNGANITISTLPPATPTVSIIQPTCSTPTGTITVNSPSDAGITYSINGTVYQASNVFNNVAPGNYNVTAKNSGGCVSSSSPATINAAPADNQPPSIPSNITVSLDASGHATIQPADVASLITDNCAVNPNSITVSSNSFDCSSLNGNAAASYQAYVSNTATGNQTYLGELGMDFTVNNANGIQINQLGAFDHQANGITGTQSGGVRVAIFNRTTQAVVPGLDVIISGSNDPLVANHRMRSIPAVTLMPGNYVIVAKGYNAAELNGNAGVSGGPFAAGDNGSGAITYTNRISWGANNSSTSFGYPPNAATASTNEYHAGTFNYTSVSTGTTASYQAYVSNTATGNQTYLGELGMDFTVNNANGIQINQLGAFDHQANGITGTQSGGVRVAIFNRTTQAVVPGLDVIISGSNDPLVANHRMRSIPAVTLMPGNYVIVAKGYNAAELNGNAGVSGGPFAAGDNGSGAITYTNRISWGANNSSTSFGYPPNAATASTNEYHAGTFNYTSGSTSTAASYQAYVSNTATGNQTYLGELGMDFTVNNANGIQINQLGAFDHQANGITGTQSGGIRVAIFNRTTQAVVPGLDVIISGSNDPLVANHRMRSIPAVTLMPGNYVIVAKGYNAAELNGNAGVSGGPFAAGDNGSGAITYTNRISWGANNSSTSFGYPPNAATASTNEYHAGTFNYTSGSTSTAASYQAYVSNTATGNQTYLGELGMDFTVNNANGIQINQLGAFDHQANGITGTQSGGIRVAIFNRTTQAVVPGLDVIISGSNDPLVANHRMRSIPAVTLMPGNYVIVAKGYNAAELNGNAGVSGGPFAAGDNGSGAITYTNRISWGANNSSTSFGYPPNAATASTNEYHAGTFNYTSGSTSTAASYQAYVSNTATGNQTYLGELGMDFTVNNANGIQINQLGAFDHQANGITGTQSGGVRVAIFNRTTQAVVPGLDVIISGSNDPLVSNHRMRSIPAVTLMPGNYVIVAKGYNAAELNGNAGVSGGPFAAGDNGSGAITYTNRISWGANNSSTSFGYPPNAATASTNEYHAGTFNYLPAAAVNTVTISATDMSGNVSQVTVNVTVTDPNNSCSAAIAAAIAGSISPAQQPAEVLTEGSKLRVYPNPSSGTFNVLLSHFSGAKVRIEITDGNGKTVAVKALTLPNKTPVLTVPFDLSNKASGMYWIRAVSASGVQTAKLMIQR